MINNQERLLESKMTEIEQARSWSPRVIHPPGAEHFQPLWQC